MWILFHIYCLKMSKSGTGKVELKKKIPHGCIVIQVLHLPLKHLVLATVGQRTKWSNSLTQNGNSCIPVKVLGVNDFGGLKMAFDINYCVWDRRDLNEEKIQRLAYCNGDMVPIWWVFLGTYPTNHLYKAMDLLIYGRPFSQEEIWEETRNVFVFPSLRAKYCNEFVGLLLGTFQQPPSRGLHNLRSSGKVSTIRVQREEARDRERAGQAGSAVAAGVDSWTERNTLFSGTGSSRIRRTRGCGLQVGRTVWRDWDSLGLSYFYALVWTAPKG